MASQSLTRRYARAILEIGLEESTENAAQAFLHHLKIFADVLLEKDDAGTPILQEALLNPALTLNDKSAVLEKILEKLPLHTHVKNFIRILLEKNRLVLFHEIIATYQSLLDKHQGIVRATVTTVNEISAEEKAEIRVTLASDANLQTEKLLVEYKTDTEIIGGVVAQVGNKIYDASVKTKLQNMERALISSNV
jgi:F-type H+-transporting ATPase subunit delta